MIPNPLPKGTTLEQWERYELDEHNHMAWCKSRQEFAETVIKFVQMYGPVEAFERIKKSIDEIRSMDAPNKPGYYRANND